MEAQVISLEGLEVHEDGPEHGWSGTLTIDGVGLMEIERGPDGGFVASGEADDDEGLILGLLDEFTASTGEPVETTDGGLRPETLDDRIASLVAVGWIIRRTSDMLRSSAVAVTDDGLVEARVPEGGTLEGAIAHVRRIHPQAVILNDLPIEDAAVEWTRHA